MANEKVNGHESEEPLEKHQKLAAAQAAEEAERRMRERHAQAQAEEAAVAAKPAEPEQPAAQQGPRVLHQVTIAVYDNGAVNVNGPMEDPILFQGMLAAAKQIAERQWNKLMDQAERRAAEAQRIAASAQGKKGAMKDLFGRIGRGLSRTA